ncbi:MAG: hypothetical protein BM485_10975 [Desulfobulbaceae bacterium DB1]|nr:MAG: hypothetical protein BM485_10975 [Desulfobulbaceae bacterium DB1]
MQPLKSENDAMTPAVRSIFRPRKKKFPGIAMDVPPNAKSRKVFPATTIGTSLSPEGVKNERASLKKLV